VRRSSYRLVILFLFFAQFAEMSQVNPLSVLTGVPVNIISIPLFVIFPEFTYVKPTPVDPDI
jgi:hypothetical protein